MEDNTALEEHASNIVERLAVSKKDKQDMKDEFISHLQAAKEDYEEQGYTEKEARKLAIFNFGNSGKVADDMHEAIFPHRKLLLLILAGLSLITTFSTYLALLFTQGDAAYGGLITTVLSSIGLLLLSEGKYPKWEKKQYLITLLIMHTLFFVYQALTASSIGHFINKPLSILCYTIILFSIILIYRVVTAGSFQTNSVKWLHIINITIGIFFTAYGLFMLWASLIFAEGLYMVSLIGGIPFAIWLIAYILQIQFVKHNRNKSACIVLILLGVFIIFYLSKYVLRMMLI